MNEINILTYTSALTLFVGVCFLIAYFAINRSQKKKNKNCILPVIATVTGNERKCTGSQMPKMDDAPLNFAVYEYDVYGRHYKKVSSVGYSKPKYKDGEKVNILCNPENPKEYYVPSDSKALGILKYIMLGLGLLFIITGVIILFFL